MSDAIRAIYENGVFKPLQSLDLPENQTVRLIVESDSSDAPSNGAAEGTDPLAGIRAATGITDLAEKFDDYRFGNRTP